MLLQRAQLWELHDYLIERNFLLFSESRALDYESNDTQWQHEPSGSIVKVPAKLTLRGALDIAYLAHTANRKYPSDE
jgi:hypothetical protein